MDLKKKSFTCFHREKNKRRAERRRKRRLNDSTVLPTSQLVQKAKLEKRIIIKYFHLLKKKK